METLDKLAALRQIDKDITDADYRRKVERIMCWKQALKGYLSFLSKKTQYV